MSVHVLLEVFPSPTRLKTRVFLMSTLANYYQLTIAFALCDVWMPHNQLTMCQFRAIFRMHHMNLWRSNQFSIWSDENNNPPSLSQGLIGGFMIAVDSWFHPSLQGSLHVLNMRMTWQRKHALIGCSRVRPVINYSWHTIGVKSFPSRAPLLAVVKGCQWVPQPVIRSPSF